VEPVKICNELEDTQINQKILIDKTVSEFAKFINKANVYLDHLKWKSSIVINDVECLHFQEIWPPLKKIIHNNYLEGKLSLIHGDFCFANILHDLSDNKIILVDPRGSYHIRGCFGDKAYDYAKLLHSVHGNYEQIIYDDYDFYLNKNEINYTFKYNFDDLNEILKKEIDPHLFEKSKLIEGLLFISMCSRHYDNEQHQFIMYCQGLSILNQIIKNQSNFSNY
jgi:hypothetical protein